MSDPILNELTITVSGTVRVSGAINVTSVIQIVPEPPDPIPPIESDTLFVEIDYQGELYSFDETTGIDLGDYIEPGGHFVQRNVLVVNDGLPYFTVQFRRDRSGTRDEIVFELGTLFTGTPANMAPHVVTIYRGDTIIERIEAPNGHYWNSRWRWYSEPRPIIYPVDSLLGNKLPNYSDELFGNKIPLSTPRSYLGPMDLAGITAYIPSTGERDEIGICTEAQAEYICQRTQTAWASVLAQLEASGSIPWHFRDEETNAPLNVNEYPNATMYSPNGANPYIHNPPSPITLDVAHEGSFAYVPFVLTGDPYALEEMQFYTTYNIVMQPSQSRQNWNLGNGVRAVAWTLRALMHNATITPDDVPSWLQPKEYFKALLDKERDWFLTKFVNSNVAPHNNLNLINDSKGSIASGAFPAGTWLNVWQEDFVTTVLGWIVQLGHDDWKPILQWKVFDTLARSDGSSGWIRAVPTVYMLAIRPIDNAPVVFDWTGCWELNVQIQPDAMAYTDKNTIPASTSLTYPSYMLGALAISARLGVDSAKESYDWLLEQLQDNTTTSKYIERKWAIGVN